MESWNATDEYLANHLLASDPVLDAALQASEAAGLPAIAVSPLQGRFLALLARGMGARRVLEIGTLGGYSTIWLARALPADGSLVTLELEPRHAAVARSNLQRAQLEASVEVREGPAIESLARLAEEGGPPFDFVFVDADKQRSAEYFDWAVRLGRPGTFVVVDNVVRKGAVADEGSSDERVRGVRRLYQLLRGDKRVEATALQTVGSKGHDGFLLARVK